MHIANGLLNTPQGTERFQRNSFAEVQALLDRTFGARFALVEGETGDLVYLPTGEPIGDWNVRVALCQAIARRGRPEFLDDEAPVLVLGVPMALDDDTTLVGVSTFLSRPVQPGESLDGPAAHLGISRAELSRWSQQQQPWNAGSLLRVAELAMAQWQASQRVVRLEQETVSLSDHLAATYEEITLLHRLTQNLKLSKSDEELGRVALDWLAEVLPAQALAIRLLPVSGKPSSPSQKLRTEPLLITHGDFAWTDQEVARLIDHLGSSGKTQPLVLNPPVTEAADWPVRGIRELIAVPLAENQNLFGWMLAFNHIGHGQFGTVEANLLGSVAAILGIHGGNIELYRQQSELLAGVVRALTSAIDAKDPYTCGHSDRVARISVRLAQELGCDARLLNTIYLSGLLHDIGKIGIDDHVLRKPGKLTDDEYEHIKQHVRIGHRILIDLRKLDDVLPVVLHHHESWDGTGYPGKLAGAQIPLPARIVSVADAYDAMGSDRPYRKGLAEDKIGEVFRAGAGKQWDPEIVAAFFRAQVDLREIVHKSSDDDDVEVLTFV